MAVEPKDIQNFVKAVVDALTQKHDPLVEGIKIAIWPSVIIFGFLCLLKPLRRFLEGVSRSVTKFSILPVSFEFEAAKTQQFSLSNFSTFPGEDLTGGMQAPSNTTIQTLIDLIRDKTPPFYLLVDIGTGNRWLISRLFLFTFILKRIGDLKCVVFVQTHAQRVKELLGIADPEKVCDVLGEKYPWLHTALLQASSGEGRDEHNQPLPQHALGEIPLVGAPLPRNVTWIVIERFMANGLLRRSTPPPTPGAEEWEQLQGDGAVMWEHTKWLNVRHVNEDLRLVFDDDDSSRFVDSPDISTNDRNKALLCRKAPFVALVNANGELKSLVDRSIFLDRLAIYLAREAENQMP